ncbi:hypothetical protein BDW59DRAFT_161316 [Aspergillus cavernicola]|uniref:Uncharacterized protein n=1 Tax=Aspergillus cavernicola TaxID=176166 RepID=A0ABR4IDW6_9EURO
MPPLLEQTLQILSLLLIANLFRLFLGYIDTLMRRQRDRVRMVVMGREWAEGRVLDLLPVLDPDPDTGGRGRRRQDLAELEFLGHLQDILMEDVT